MLGYGSDVLVGRPVVELYANGSNGKTKAQEVIRRFRLFDLGEYAKS